MNFEKALLGEATLCWVDLFNADEPWGHSNESENRTVKGEPWEAVDWMDDNKPITIQIGPYLHVDDQNTEDYGPSFAVQPSGEVVEAIKRSMVAIAHDSICFSIIIYKDTSRAALLANYSTILGSRLIAWIDASTIPAQAQEA